MISQTFTFQPPRHKCPITRWLLPLLCISGLALGPELAFGQAKTQEPKTQATTQDKPAATEKTGNTETTPAVAKQPEQPPEPPPYNSRAERDMKLLASREQDPLWLEGGGETFLAFFNPNLDPEPKGALLILHAEGQHPRWPLILDPLANHLPEHGWATLSIALPNPDPKPVPKRPPPPEPKPADNPEAGSEATPEATPEANDDKAGQTSEDKKADKKNAAPKKPKRPESEEIYDAENDALIDSKQQPAPVTVERPMEKKPGIPANSRALARIEAAFGYLQEQGQFNIALLGDGIGAAWAGEFFSQLPPVTPPPEGDEESTNSGHPIRAMLILNARNTITATDLNLTQSLTTPEVPVLDIYFGIDLRDHPEARARRKIAKQNKLQTYQQIRLPELVGPVNAQENRLSKRIRGFLNKHAAGQEIPSAKLVDKADTTL